MSTAPSREHSVATSLHELRAIEQQRRSDEAASARAREAEREAAEAARAAALAAVRAEEARRVAEVEAQVAAARRADALTVACAEATARVHADAELAAVRMASELAVRREAVARTRPLALVAALGALALGVFAMGWVLVAQRADLAEREAALQASLARSEKLSRDTADLARAAHDLQDEVDRRNRELDALKARAAAVAPAPVAPAPVTPRPPRVGPTPPAVRPPVVVDPACTTSVLGCMKPQ